MDTAAWMDEQDQCETLQLEFPSEGSVLAMKTNSKRGKQRFKAKYREGLSETGLGRGSWALRKALPFTQLRTLHPGQ